MRKRSERSIDLDSENKAMMHRLDAGPDTVHWGFFEATLPPLLTIDSGDRVTISTVSGPAEFMPPPPFEVPQPLRAIHQQVTRKTLPGHICTGPVAVRGAKPGQVLQVDIESTELHYEWGFNNIAPLRGSLPYDFEAERVIHIALDRERMVGRLPWGMEVPLRPFFGVLAVAPPAAWGTLSTIPPRPNGGNIDNKELVAGTTLYLPIFVEGAMFSAGDGHGAQGDGEVCLSAIETGLIGTFRLTVRDDVKLDWPMGETPTHFITMAFDPDLDDCVVIALRQMLDLICARTKLDRYQAYTLCSLAADLRITQVVNGSKGVHVMLEKRYVQQV
jgi:acetamidase/formamidase